MAKRSLYVLGLRADGTCWALTTQPDTLSECERTIRWQERSSLGRTQWRIAAWDAAKQVFVSQQGEELQPERGPYTLEAWEEFLSTLPKREA